MVPASIDGYAVTSIYSRNGWLGYGLFEECITSVVLPDGLTSIGSGTFCGCENLTSINIPSTVTEIGESAFSGCSTLKDIYYIGSKKQWKISGLDDDFPILAAVYCTHSYGEDETFKKNNAQYRITSVDKKNVEYMKPVKKKASVTIPDTVKVNGKSYKVTSILPSAFYNNKKLKSVTIGKNVTYIGCSAFYNCKNLKTIMIKGSSLKYVGNSSIDGIHKKAVIKVPKKKYKTYRKLFTSATGYKKTMKIKKY